MFPNIVQFPKIACSLCITSCECERSASVIRRLDTYMRHTMNEDCLTGLALIHIHFDMHVDLDEGVKNLHPRRLELESLLLD